MEQVIIVGQPSQKPKSIFLKIGVISLLVFLLLYIFNVGGCRIHEWIRGIYEPTLFDLMIFDAGSGILPSLFLDLGLLFCIIGGIFYIACAKISITVTDKRVYGTALWGKRVDLPLDAISAVGSKWPKGITVASSSGKIAFVMIKNRDEIHKCVSDLLIERQTKPTAATAIKQEAPKSDADELKKYKELLDSGIITQEEFDAKKKQLLGLS